MDCTFGIKNEIKFNNANEWVALGSKAYAYKNENNKYNQTAKGLQLQDNKMITEYESGKEKYLFDVYNEIIQN